MINIIAENEEIYNKYIEDFDTNDVFTVIKEKSIDYNSLATSINNIIMLADGSKFGKELNEIWDNYCKDKQICPCCGEETHIEDGYSVCDNCG